MQLLPISTVPLKELSMHSQVILSLLGRTVWLELMYVHKYFLLAQRIIFDAVFQHETILHSLINTHVSILIVFYVFPLTPVSGIDSCGLAFPSCYLRLGMIF